MPSNQPSRAERLDALTGVRALAAWIVVIYHWSPSVSLLFPSLKSLDHVVHQGELGVDIFFILSGFILIHTYHTYFPRLIWSEYRRFVWLRFARVYPAYLAALLGMVAMVLAAKASGVKHRDSGYSSEILPWEFLMLHAWRPGDFVAGWNYPDWSVSAEWFAYTLIFPPTVLLVNRLKSPVTAALLALLAIGIYNGILGHGTRVNRLNNELAYVSLYFVAGALGWRVWQSYRERIETLPGGPISQWIPFVAAVLIVLLPGGYEWYRSTTLIGLIWVGLLVLGVSKSGPAKLFSLSWVVYWGEASYALYLSHGLVIRIFKALVDAEKYIGTSTTLRLLWVAAAIVATVIAAMTLHHWIEEPARRWLRKFGRDTAGSG